MKIWLLLDVLLWAVVDEILRILLKNGFEMVDFRSTVVNGLVKVVYMLIIVAGLEIVELVLIWVMVL